MKDIDFDELDKAVNSLMASSTQAKNTFSQQPEAPSETVMNIDTSAGKYNTSPSSGDKAAAAKTDSTTAVPLSGSPNVTVPDRTTATRLPLARRGGRFMDMVQKPTPAATRVSTTTTSRVGSSITPRPEVASGISQESSLADTSELSTDASEVRSESAPTKPESIPASLQEAPTLRQPSRPYADDSISGLTITAADTPFINDAKVEKRPLNSDNSAITQNSELKELLPADDNGEILFEDTDDRGTDEPPVIPEVPELETHLVSIESGDTSAMSESTDTSPSAANTDKATTLGPTSIAQQYTRQESSGDKSHAAIYDSSQYSEPVTHPTNGRSEWLWIIWMIALLGVGAGVALLLYNFGIIP